jgi:hypothetical protein
VVMSRGAIQHGEQPIRRSPPLPEDCFEVRLAGQPQAGIEPVWVTTRRRAWPDVSFQVLRRARPLARRRLRICRPPGLAMRARNP